jgi:hypothetical protein
MTRKNGLIETIIADLRGGKALGVGWDATGREFARDIISIDGLRRERQPA